MKGADIMPFSYAPLWKLIANRRLNKTSFRQLVGISTATLAKLSSNQVVSMDILAKICERLGCKMEDVVEYQSEMEQFMRSLKGKVDHCEYTVYCDRWPQCRFTLNNQQVALFTTIDVKTIIMNCENDANRENQPNAGIIGTTDIQFVPSTSELVINGSFAVTQKFITYFLNLN